MTGAVVLMYHRIGNGVLPGREPGEELYSVPFERFQQQLYELTADRHTVVGCDALAAAALDGGSLPERAVALTFDDGNITDHSLVLPVLLSLEYSAVFFISPALVGEEGYLGWEEIRELAAAGMTIGVHGLDHRPLSSLEDGELQRQLRTARRLIEARLGQAPSLLSLPGGAGGRRVAAAALTAGYRLVFGSTPRVLRPGANRFELPRFPVRRTDSMKKFQSLLEQRRIGILRYSIRYRAAGWLRNSVGERFYQKIRQTYTEASRAS